MTEQKTTETILESHRDNPNFDEIYLADSDWLSLNKGDKHVTKIEEVGSKWVVGINYLWDDDVATS